MKYTSRSQKMEEYNQKYPIRTSDVDALVERMLRDYLADQKKPEKVIAKAREIGRAHV